MAYCCNRRSVNGCNVLEGLSDVLSIAVGKSTDTLFPISIRSHKAIHQFSELIIDNDENWCKRLNLLDWSLIKRVSEFVKLV